MELVKNNASGKYFVVLDDTGEDEFLVITPEGKVKRLERRLFGPRNIVDPKKTMRVRHLTPTQIDKYSEYLDE
ncbi:hypothetical protein [Desulfococcus sp.]|uniref:hypothetical protein n=1 Tax=Desulfococcus sp. TaxID=2025834 RepID=UPI0035940D6C